VIATAIIGVKFGGCGISLAKAKNKIKLIGKSSLLRVFDKFIISNIFY